MMARRRKREVEEHEQLALRLTGYSARVDASISYKVRDLRNYDEDARVYAFESVVELQATATWPEERSGQQYSLTVYGREPSPGEFSVTLAQCRARDEEGRLVFKKVHGNEIPKFEVPKGIGHLDRIRGTQGWTGWAWVSRRTVSDMLRLLSNVEPLYVAIHEFRLGRHRWIVGLTIQTTNPAEE